MLVGLDEGRALRQPLELFRAGVGAGAANAAEQILNGVADGTAIGHLDFAALRVLDRLLPGSSDWLLLFQLGSSEESEMMWGDGGKLYFWIREQDLSALRFDNVWMVLQCY